MRAGREVVEELAAGEIPLWRHPEWARSYPWLVQGTTGEGGAEPFDLGLFGTQPVGAALGRWHALRRALAMPGVVHARQVHGADVRRHDAAHEGLLLQEGYDGHVTARPGLLLTASVADCVPVFLLDEGTRTVAVLHAGWRGAAAGIAERAVALLHGAGVSPEGLRAHCGPAICGACYEVGPEVHAALAPGPPPGSPAPIDLRRALVGRLVAAGLEPRAITVSAHCTRCGPGGFFSHRGGSAARQMGVIGRRE